MIAQKSLSVFFRQPDHQDRYLGTPDHAPRGASDHDVFERSVSVGSHHDEITI
jgi:hypothetical protein